METPAKPEDRILVIDDDAIMRELLVLLLGADGYTVLTSESGDDALELLSSTSKPQLPSVVLADLKMPGVSHSELAEGLRGLCPAPAVLLAMSASEPVGDDAAGFDGFLLKPFSVAEFEAAVERARAGTAAGPGGASGTGADAEPALNEAIFSRLMSTMGADQMRQIYAMCLDDAAARVERISTALNVNDAVTFIRESHSLKGGCGMLGATELSSLAGRMETGGLACSPLLGDFPAAFERLQRILEERIDRDVDGRAEPQT